MKVYDGQPEEGEIDNWILKRRIAELLEEQLPDCRENEWFLKSIYFSNLMDKIEELIDKAEDGVL